MLTKFWEGVGEQLAEKWLTFVLAPAFAFWVGGVLAWVWKFGWTDLTQNLAPLSTVELGALIVAALLVVAASAAIMRRFELPLLRLLEGYWPHRIDFLRQRLINKQQERLQQREQEWQTLIAKGITNLTPAERRQYARLDRQLRLFPSDPADLLPTALGNRLRSAETWPAHKYGLNAIVVWPHLWLLLPDNVRQDLTQARAELDTDARFLAWGILFAIWTIWTWWALPVAIIAVILAYNSVLNTAERYGSLLEATFDVHRVALYKALRWPLPAHPEEERTTGAQVTEYLWRGGHGQTPTFTAQTSKSDD